MQRAQSLGHRHGQSKTKTQTRMGRKHRKHKKQRPRNPRAKPADLGELRERIESLEGDLVGTKELLEKEKILLSRYHASGDRSLVPMCTIKITRLLKRSNSIRAELHELDHEYDLASIEKENQLKNE